ncbi:MAG: PQQ-binding-like beta-propeller repeat protein [Planctomycetota bacterium]
MSSNRAFGNSIFEDGFSIRLLLSIGTIYNSALDRQGKRILGTERCRKLDESNPNTSCPNRFGLTVRQPKPTKTKNIPLSIATKVNLMQFSKSYFAVALLGSVLLLSPSIGVAQVGENDAAQMLGSSQRNNVSDQENIPVAWDVASGENILWSLELGTEAYASPAVANGKIFIATNNEAGYVKRLPAEKDLGVLIAADEATGKFLWQHSNEKLEAGEYADWPHQGVCATPFIDGDRLWYVSNRCEVICLDVEGFHDGENDGEKNEPNENKDEADVIWKLDMRNKLGVMQLYMATCSITGVGDKIFVTTSNGVDADDQVIAPEAPSLLCLNRDTGEVLWSDNTVGGDILHGQWSSPSYGNIGGVEQVIFGAGNGWIYSFDPAGDAGKSKLLWKFDCNPKESYFEEGGAGTRAYIIGTPVIHKDRVYIGVGEDPEYGDKQGHLWCIDATKRGDISPTLVKVSSTRKPEEVRIQAYDPEAGDQEMDNPNTGAIWHYEGNNPKNFEETMHRTIGSVAIRNGLLFVADFSGLFHCVDSETGKAYWTEDMFSGCWGSPTIVQDRVYIANTDGDVLIFKVAKEKDQIDVINVETSVLTTPVVANNRMYIAGRGVLIAIEEGAQSDPEE